MQIPMCVCDYISFLVFVTETSLYLYEIWAEAEGKVGNLSMTNKQD